MTNFNPPTGQLVHWKPGQSGNPKGRPVGAIDAKRRVADMIQYYLSLSRKDKLPNILKTAMDRVDKDQKDMTAIQALIAVHLARALNGDTKSFKMIMEYGIGKATATPDDDAANPIEHVDVQSLAKRVSFIMAKALQDKAATAIAKPDDANITEPAETAPESVV